MWIRTVIQSFCLIPRYHEFHQKSKVPFLRDRWVIWFKSEINFWTWVNEYIMSYNFLEDMWVIWFNPENNVRSHVKDFFKIHLLNNSHLKKRQKRRSKRTIKALQNSMFWYPIKSLFDLIQYYDYILQDKAIKITCWNATPKAQIYIKNNVSSRK